MYRIIFLSLFLFSTMHIYSQKTDSIVSDCRVLMIEISQHYQGDCKNGFAHGRGKATGIDTYTGKFKHGLPHGKGTYIRANKDTFVGRWKKGKMHGNGVFTYNLESGKDSVVRGRWINGKLVSVVKPKPYNIITKRNAGRVSIKRIGERNKVEIQVKRHGVVMNGVGFQLWSNNGESIQSPAFTGFDNVSFPFKGSVKYTISNTLNTAYYNVEVVFEIKEPGRWLVEIVN